MRLKHGFTLLEMSLVLLILSLIIGGIVVGQNIVRASEIRSVVEESRQYTSAVSDFRDKFGALPGDFSTASNYFGSSPPSSCPALTAGTCNGDGNGRITDQDPSDANDSAEQFLAWHHLYLAKMIDAKVTGIAGSAGTFDRVPRVNIPASKLSGAGWGLITLTMSDISGGVLYLRYKVGDMPPNVLLWLGGRSVTGTDNRQYGVLTTDEAYSLDMKIDDGFPNTGQLVAQYGVTTPYCVILSGATSPYGITQQGLNCALAFKTGL